MGCPSPQQIRIGLSLLTIESQWFVPPHNRVAVVRPPSLSGRSGASLPTTESQSFVPPHYRVAVGRPSPQQSRSGSSNQRRAAGSLACVGLQHQVHGFENEIHGGGQEASQGISRVPNWFRCFICASSLVAHNSNFVTPPQFSLFGVRGALPLKRWNVQFLLATPLKSGNLRFFLATPIKSWNVQVLLATPLKSRRRYSFSQRSLKLEFAVPPHRVSSQRFPPPQSRVEWFVSPRHRSSPFSGLLLLPPCSLLPQKLISVFVSLALRRTTLTRLHSDTCSPPHTRSCPPVACSGDFMSRVPADGRQSEVVSVESPGIPAAVVLPATQQQQQPLPPLTGPWAVSLGGCSFTIDEGNSRRLDQAAHDAVTLARILSSNNLQLDPAALASTVSDILNEFRRDAPEAAAAEAIRNTPWPHPSSHFSR